MPNLALVMIVRDEAHSLERCLKSAKPFVDKMIVLDTGSKDETVRIAESCGAIVSTFRWIDDFSAARNAALDLSDAEWNLILDGDEWIDDGKLLLDFPDTDAFIGTIPIASHFDLNGRVEVSVSWIPRLLPKGVRYKGHVHEQPDSMLPRRPLNVKVGHDGYRQERIMQKQGRNRDLLLKAIAESPEDAYFYYQLGKDYEVYEDFNRAVEHYRQALAFSSLADTFRHDLVVRTIFSLKKADCHEEAIQFAEAEMTNWPDSPDFFFSLGDLLLDWAVLNPAKAYQDLLPMVESCWRKCLEIGERPMLAGSVRGRGSYLAAQNLAVLYDGVGNQSEAEKFREMALHLRSTC